VAETEPLRCRACGFPVEWVIKTLPTSDGTFKRRTLIDTEGRNHFAICQWAEANAMDRVEVMAARR
jgi:hypothetical protein